jgi:hypothetical protein
VSANNPPSSRPAGFVFLAVCALLCALALAILLATGDELPRVRFALGATGALALVTAEALAYVRPWAFGASLAFAGSFVALVFVATHDFVVGVVGTCPTILPILVALSVVHNGLAAHPGTAQGKPRRNGLP